MGRLIKQDGIDSLHVAAEESECGKTRFYEDPDVVRDAFRAAAETEVQSEADLVNLIDGSRKLLRASNTTDEIALSHNVKIWEKIDQAMTYDKIRNIEDMAKKGKTTEINAYDRVGKIVTATTYEKIENIVGDMTYERLGKITKSITYDKFGKVDKVMTLNKLKKIDKKITSDKMKQILDALMLDKLKKVDKSVTTEKATKIVESITYNDNGKIDKASTIAKLRIVDQTMRDTKLEEIVEAMTYNKLEVISETMTYNMMEAIVQSVVHDGKGNIDRTTTYEKVKALDKSMTHEQVGNLIDAVVFDNMGKIDKAKSYQKLGRTAETITNAKVRKLLQAITYDEVGNPNKVMTLDKMRKIDQTMTKDQMKEIFEAVQEDKSVGKTGKKFDYDKMGKIVTQTTYEKIENIVADMTYKKMGKITESVTYDQSRMIDKMNTLKKLKKIDGEMTSEKMEHILDMLMLDNLRKVDESITADKAKNIAETSTYDSMGKIDKASTIAKLRKLDKTMSDTKLEEIVEAMTYNKLEVISETMTYNTMESIVQSVIRDAKGNIDKTATYQEMKTLDEAISDDQIEKVIDGIVFDSMGKVDETKSYEKIGKISESISNAKMRKLVEAITYDNTENLNKAVTLEKMRNIDQTMTTDQMEKIIEASQDDESVGKTVEKINYDKMGKIVQPNAFEKMKNAVDNMNFEKMGKLVEAITYGKKASVDKVATVEKMRKIDDAITQNKIEEVLDIMTDDKIGKVVKAVNHDKVKKIIDAVMYDNLGNVDKSATHSKMKVIEQTITNDVMEDILDAMTYKNLTHVNKLLTFENMQNLDQSLTRDTMEKLIEAVTYDRKRSIDKVVTFSKMKNIDGDLTNEKMEKLVKAVTYDETGNINKGVTFSKMKNINGDLTNDAMESLMEAVTYDDTVNKIDKDATFTKMKSIDGELTDERMGKLLNAVRFKTIKKLEMETTHIKVQKIIQDAKLKRILDTTPKDKAEKIDKATTLEAMQQIDDGITTGIMEQLLKSVVQDSGGNVDKVKTYGKMRKINAAMTYEKIKKSVDAVTYDETGNVDETSTLNKMKHIDRSMTHEKMEVILDALTMNKLGKVFESMTYDMMEKLVQAVNHDESGNIDEAETYAKMKKFNETITKDEMNQIIQAISYDKMTNKVDYVNTYEKLGKIVERMTKKKIQAFESVITYDNDGNIQTTTTYNKMKQIDNSITDEQLVKVVEAITYGKEKKEVEVIEHVTGDAYETMANIFKHAAATNEAMNGWQAKENSVDTEESDIMMEKKEKFSEHANNVLERFTDYLLDNKPVKHTEVETLGGYFGLIPLNISNLTKPLSLRNSMVQIPTLCFEGSDTCKDKENEAFVKITAFDSNFYDFIEPRRVLNGGSVNVSMLLAKKGTDQYEEIEIPEMHKPIVLRFPIKSRNLTSDNATFMIPYLKEKQLLVYYEIEVDITQSKLMILMVKSNPSASLVLYFHQNRMPWPTDYLQKIEFPANQEKLVWQLEVPKIEGARNLLGFAEIKKDSASGINFGGYVFSRRFTTNYSIDFYGASCVSLEFSPLIQDRVWSSEGCQIGEETTESEVVCRCSHMSTFAAGIVVAPNSIDFDYVLTHMSVELNPSIYATLLVFLLIYTLSMIWGFRKDKINRKTNICIPLPDNSFNHKHFYKISVKTGLNGSASTDSVIRFVLFGKHGTTQVKRFPSSNKLFRRGQTDHFLMSTKEPLGDLECIKIWHDNTGSGQFACWFLHSITVYDAIENLSYHFFCNKWLSMDHEPHTTEQMVPLSDTTLVQSFKIAFERNLSKKLLHDHLWFSVVALPKVTVFTRCQRITCCFCVVLTSMLASAMWYGKKEQPSKQADVQIGPFSVSWNEMFIGFATSLVVFPINFLIVQIFKRTNPKENNLETLAKKTELPWWFVYIGWCLVLVTILVSMVFILFYAIQMGDSETRKWLASIFLSLFSSIFFAQPLKVLVIVIIISAIWQKIDVDSEERAIRLMTPTAEAVKDKIHGGVSKTDDQHKEFMMKSLSRELVITLTFIVITFLLIHGNRNENAYHLQHQITQTLTGKLMEKVEALKQQQSDVILPHLRMENEKEFWNWAVDVLVPALGGRNNLKKGLMIDDVNKVVGYAAIRQIRVERDSCSILPKVKHLFQECVDFFTIFNSDDKSYGPQWSDKVSKYRPEYHFMSATQLTTMPKEGLFGLYTGGAYTVLLRKWVKKVQNQLRTLEKEKWIDFQTRAIIIEFSIYNVQVNLFCVGHVLIETPPTGGFMPSVNFLIVQLLKHDPMQVVREVLYVLSVLMLMWVMTKNFMNVGCGKFFKTWNTLLDFITVFLSFIIFAVYYTRSKETDRVLQIVNKTKGKAFVDMSYAAILEQAYNYLIGFVGFVTTAKLVRLLRFNRRVSLMTDILVQASSAIMGFGCVAIIIMAAFSCLFYIMLGTQLHHFNTVLKCLEKCFGFILYRMHFLEPLVAVKPTLGPFAVAAYFIAAVMLIDNIFITTLNVMLDVVRRDTDKQNNDYEIVQYAKRKVMTYVASNRNSKKNSGMNQLEVDTENRIKLLEMKAKDFDAFIISHFCDQSKQKADKAHKRNAKIVGSD